MLLLPQRKQGLTERKRAVRVAVPPEGSLERRRRRRRSRAKERVGGGGDACLQPRERVLASARQAIPVRHGDEGASANGEDLRGRDEPAGRMREWSVPGGAGGAQNPPPALEQERRRRTHVPTVNRRHLRRSTATRASWYSETLRGRSDSRSGASPPRKDAWKARQPVRSKSGGDEATESTRSDMAASTGRVARARAALLNTARALPRSAHWQHVRDVRAAVPDSMILSSLAFAVRRRRRQRFRALRLSQAHQTLPPSHSRCSRAVAAAACLFRPSMCNVCAPVGALPLHPRGGRLRRPLGRRRRLNRRPPPPRRLLPPPRRSFLSCSWQTVARLPAA